MKSYSNHSSYLEFRPTEVWLVCFCGVFKDLLTNVLFASKYHQFGNLINHFFFQKEKFHYS